MSLRSSVHGVRDGIRAITYDRRGFGHSDQPWMAYDYGTLANDLAAVMEQTNARDATLLGFSKGGGEVARYMSRHAGMNVKQAVLVSSVVPYMLKTDTNPVGVDHVTFDKMAAGIKADRAKFWSSFFKDFYGVGIVSHPTSDEVLERSRGVARQASLKATLDCAAAFARTDVRPELAAFNVPTLLIHGTDDQTVPIDCSSRAAAAGIRNCQLIEYAGAPHGLFATHKEQLIADVLRFLQTPAMLPETQASGMRVDLIHT